MKFDIIFHGLNEDDFVKDRRTLVIEYDKPGVAERFRFLYSYPVHILQELGTKELASRIYSVFKQHISRPASE
jgi:hypothetical protein